MSADDVGHPPAPDLDDRPGDTPPNTDAQPPPTYEDGKLDEDRKQSNSWIRYSFEWRGEDNEFKARREVSADDAEHNSGLSSGTPAFERVTVFRVKHREGEKDAFDVTPSLTGTTPEYHLRIYSVGIIHALRSVVQYYPKQDLTGDVIKVPWPYPVLVHHYDELRHFRETSTKKQPSETCVRERHVDGHLGLLLGFLDREVMDQVNAEKERNKRGYFTFDYRWVSHRPGTTILQRLSGQLEWQGAVVYSIEGGLFSQPRQPWCVRHWAVENDDSELIRTETATFMDRFDGERSFHEGCIIILGNGRLDEDKLQGDIARQKVAYGKVYWDLMNKQCRYHEGMTMGSPQRDIQGMVMADLKAYSEISAPSNIMGRGDLRDFIPDCRCRVCNGTERIEAEKTSIFEDYTDISRVDEEELWDHIYLLCPVEIPVFIFKTRTWERVHVKNLSPPRFRRNMIENLVMDEQRRHTLMSLTESYARLNSRGQSLSNPLWAADFVEEKGNGLIFLLHGGPGVGKTFTAECVAHSLERPLMVLSTSDIGINTEAVEKNLTEQFKRAKSWNAVLLIDEADVFLSQRSIKDLHRSSLVASFLRALEFYDGILFLTTNRVGAFDDAILSRVHIQLFYPNLDEGQRQKLWMTFLTKLGADRPSIQVKYAVKEYLRSSEMREFEMNGREIRNAVQTAVALAEHRAEESEDGKTLLTEDHLREVVQMYRSFKLYFSGIHGNEGYRAQNRGERLDSIMQAIDNL